MSRKTSGVKPKRVRFTVDLPSLIDDQIVQKAAERGEQKSDVVRRALSYFLKCEELAKQGYEFQGVKKEDGETKIVIVVPA